MVGLLSRSAKSVPGRLVPADFGCVLMRSSSACATEGALWYVDEQSSMHDDVQLRESAEATAVLRSQHAEAGLVNKRLTEQVAEICAVLIGAFLMRGVGARPCLPSVQHPAKQSTRNL